MTTPEDIAQAAEYIKFITDPATIAAISKITQNMPHVIEKYNWVQAQITTMLSIQAGMLDNYKNHPGVDISDAMATLEVINSNIMDTIQELRDSIPRIEILEQYSKMLEFQGIIIVKNARDLVKRSKTR